MSKKEGEILKFAIKKANLTVQEFAEMLGYKGRTTLNYQFMKDRLDYELKEKAAKVLGTDVQTLFNAEEGGSSGEDKEKEALWKLAKTQEDLIRHQNEFITAQLIREEAFLSVILNRMVEKDYPAHKKDRPDDLSAALKQAEEDVKEKIEELRAQLRLPS